MDDLVLKPWALDFLKERYFTVMSSVSEDGRPQSAMVGYTNNDKFEFLIGTSRLSRKYKNIVANDSVSLVVADMVGEMQFEGTAIEIGREDYEVLITENGFRALPGYDIYRNDPNQTFFKITPTWIRLINHKDSNKTEEYSV